MSGARYELVMHMETVSEGIDFLRGTTVKLALGGVPSGMKQHRGGAQHTALPRP